MPRAFTDLMREARAEIREVTPRDVDALRADGRVVLTNLDGRFPPTEFVLSDNIARDADGAWGNYPRAAAQALWRETGALTRRSEPCFSRWAMNSRRLANAMSGAPAYSWK